MLKLLQFQNAPALYLPYPPSLRSEVVRTASRQVSCGTPVSEDGLIKYRINEDTGLDIIKELFHHL